MAPRRAASLPRTSGWPRVGGRATPGPAGPGEGIPRLCPSAGWQSSRPKPLGALQHVVRLANGLGFDILCRLPRRSLLASLGPTPGPEVGFPLLRPLKGVGLLPLVGLRPDLLLISLRRSSRPIASHRCLSRSDPVFVASRRKPSGRAQYTNYR